MKETKERIFSGIQPSGDIHIGNYLGAVKTWVALTQTHDCIFCIVDDHAITVDYDPKELSRRTFEAALAVMACGLDPSQCTLFVQSHVPQHTELTWLFNTVTPLGSLFRMTQFKEKSRNALAKAMSGKGEAASTLLFDLKQTGHEAAAALDALQEDLTALDPQGELDEERVARINNGLGELMARLQVGLGVSAASTGLLDYPVLQAADILLYKASAEQPVLVPVGEDQEQHLELCREVAQRFNRRFGKAVFPSVERVKGEAPRILGLDGQRKMSKSLSNHIGVLDTPKQVKKKIGSAFTDPQRLRRENPGRPEKCNVYSLHGFFTGEEARQELAQGCRSAGIGCGDCKAVLIDGINQMLDPIRGRAAHLSAHQSEVHEALAAGAQRCRSLAEATMAEVRQAMGLLPEP
ncbi:MAG: tryptophan--tRNA ligase [Myxococcota bacterium]|jgi:tryptophanyl-tRNA synthetase|nr:tryptophan--tRNA ligase [Myxococcota bacterium]